MSVLQPDPPYKPWTGVEVEPGDIVVAILDTTPQTVIAVSGEVADDGDLSAALRQTINGLDPSLPVELLEVDSVVEDIGIEPLAAGPLDSRTGVMVLERLAAVEGGDMAARFGDSSAVAARVLMDAGGWCTGCTGEIAPDDTDVRDKVYIHTVIGGMGDWPGVLCGACRDRMTRGGYARLIDYRLSLHPRCPNCSAQRTRRNQFGLRRPWNLPPWYAARGCLITPEAWLCGHCMHEW